MVKLKSSHAIPIALVLLLVIVLNGRYLWAHASFAFQKPATPVAGFVVPGDSRSRTEPDTVRIDRLGITAPIKYVAASTTEEGFQIALRDGVVHFPGTALPGEPGNVYIFGHSSDYSWSKGNYKTVFALLTKAKAGDEIIVSGHDGTAYTYVVTGTKVVGPKDTHVLDQQGKTKKLLTLQTSYPLGTALKRFLVLAELK
ncbi:MAG: sortase [Patescibacteria group bacterium]|jgi:LPXTG-site transpeptidase (sortase) family protein